MDENKENLTLFFLVCNAMPEWNMGKTSPQWKSKFCLSPVMSSMISFLYIGKHSFIAVHEVDGIGTDAGTVREMNGK